MITNEGDVEPSVELYPIEVLLYKHTQPPKSTGFSLSSLGINNIMSQLFGPSNTSINSPMPQQPVVVPPKRTLAYRASFSRRNTIKQVNHCNILLICALTFTIYGFKGLSEKTFLHFSPIFPRKNSVLKVS